MKTRSQNTGIPPLARMSWAIAVVIGSAVLVLISVVAVAQGSSLGSSYKIGPRFARTNDVISYTIVAANTGAPLSDVLLSDPVPNGAVYVAGSCTYRRLGDHPTSCNAPPDLWLEDFAVGDRITTTLAVQVTAGTMNWPLINRAYLNWEEPRQTSYTRKEPHQTSYTKEISCTTVVNPRFSNYLPLIMRDYPPMPDLRVTVLMVEPGSPAAGQPVTITVAIQNAGGVAAGPFWVDLYDNPDPPPTQANQPFDALCSGAPEDCYGIAWYVGGELGAGQTAVLTSLSGYLTEYSRWPGAFVDAGPHALYAFADSWNDPVWYGAVWEQNEGLDNRYGPVSVNVTPGTSREDGDQNTWIPQRPNHP